MRGPQTGVDGQTGYVEVPCFTQTSTPAWDDRVRVIPPFTNTQNSFSCRSAPPFAGGALP